MNRKTKDIPDAEWGDVPTVDKWAEAAKDMRRELGKPVTINPTPKRHPIFDTFKPSSDWTRSFNKARHQIVQDIGIAGNKLIATLNNGWLTVRFFEDVRIEPHSNGMVLDYHTFNYQTLDSLHSYIPQDGGLSSCIFVFGCNNGGFTFEYLITPDGCSSLAFEMTFLPLGETHA